MKSIKDHSSSLKDQSKLGSALGSQTSPLQLGQFGLRSFEQGSSWAAISDRGAAEQKKTAVILPPTRTQAKASRSQVHQRERKISLTPQAFFAIKREEFLIANITNQSHIPLPNTKAGRLENSVEL